MTYETQIAATESLIAQARVDMDRAKTSFQMVRAMNSVTMFETRLRYQVQRFSAEG